MTSSTKVKPATNPNKSSNQLGGFAIMWRSNKGNNNLISPDEAKQRGLSQNQMYMCTTCKFNKEIYEEHIDNSSKK